MPSERINAMLSLMNDHDKEELRAALNREARPKYTKLSIPCPMCQTGALQVRSEVRPAPMNVWNVVCTHCGMGGIFGKSSAEEKIEVVEMTEEEVEEYTRPVLRTQPVYDDEEYNEDEYYAGWDDEEEDEEEEEEVPVVKNKCENKCSKCEVKDKPKDEKASIKTLVQTLFDELEELIRE